MSAPEFCANAGVTIDAARQQIAAYLNLNFTELLLCTGIAISLPRLRSNIPPRALRVPGGFKEL
jgi:hypothetical protein